MSTELQVFKAAYITKCKQYNVTPLLMILTAIEQSVQAGMAMLSNLDVSGKDLADNGTIALAEALHSSRSLQHFNLWKNGVTEIGASAVAELLTYSTSIQSLTLKYNRIGDSGVSAICDGMVLNRSLTKLDLESTGLTSVAASALALMLRQNATLSVLHLGSNQIGDEGIVAIANALRVNKALLTLNVNSNGISDKAGMVLAQGLQENHVLERCYTAGNTISDHTTASIGIPIRRNIAEKSAPKPQQQAAPPSRPGLQMLTQMNVNPALPMDEPGSRAGQGAGRAGRPSRSAVSDYSGGMITSAPTLNVDDDGPGLQRRSAGGQGSTGTIGQQQQQLQQQQQQQQQQRASSDVSGAPVRMTAPPATRAMIAPPMQPHLPPPPPQVSEPDHSTTRAPASLQLMLDPPAPPLPSPSVVPMRLHSAIPMRPMSSPPHSPVSPMSAATTPPQYSVGQMAGVSRIAMRSAGSVQQQQQQQQQQPSAASIALARPATSASAAVTGTAPPDPYQDNDTQLISSNKWISDAPDPAALVPHVTNAPAASATSRSGTSPQELAAQLGSAPQRVPALAAAPLAAMSFPGQPVGPPPGPPPPIMVAPRSALVGLPAAAAPMQPAPPVAEGGLPEMVLNRYQVAGKVVTKGKSRMLYATDTRTQQRVVLKLISDPDDYIREVKMLSYVACEMIVTMSDYGRDPRIGHVIVLERAFTDLEAFLRNRDAVAAQRKAIATQIMKIFRHLLTLQVLPVDLSASKIMRFERGWKLVGGDGFQFTNSLNVTQMAAQYCSPQIVGAASTDLIRAEPSVILWAVGILILQMYCEQLYEGLDRGQVARVVQQSSFRPPLHLVVDTDVREVLLLLLNVEPNMRSLPRKL